MDFPGVRSGNRAGFVDRATQHVHDAAQGACTDRHGDAAAGVVGDQATLQAVGGAQRNRADDAVTELLLHFQRDFGAFHVQRVVHTRYVAAREFDVDDRADDLNDLALTHCCIL
ncbi:hypothetical protein D3C81_1916080 [compost metagenome]